MIRRQILGALEVCRGAGQRSAPEGEASYLQLLGEIEAAGSLSYVVDLYEQAADELAALLVQQQRTADAIATYRRVLDRWPTSGIAHGGLSRLAFSGSPYGQVLAAIHAALRPAFYLEIGVFQGESLRLAHPATFACGVDPEPRVEEPLGPSRHVFAETSDAFFARWPERPEVALRAVDLAFLDGLHRFEQTLRDFINVERRVAANATILIHDCIPVHPVVAERTQRSAFWTGDVWKLLPILWAERPDLTVEVVGAGPSGLVVVRNLDPRSDRLAGAFDACVAAHMDWGYERFVQDVLPRIRFVRSDADAIARALQAGAPL